jgi:hypothetical protein
MGWHAALLGGLATAVAANAFWLYDWVHYWFLRAPLHADSSLLTHRTLRTVWGAELWGTPADRALVLLLFAAATGGTFLYNQGGRRATARLFGLGAGALLALAVGGITWEPLGRIGAGRLLVPGLLLAVPLAVHGLLRGLEALGRRWAGVLAAVLLLALGAATPGPSVQLLERGTGAQPLAVGLPVEQLELVRLLAAHTTPDARILWEERAAGPLAARWTPLLPLWTGRAFIGGLDPDADIEHTAAGFRDQMLGGRPLDDWSDAELDRYCTRYNIGWVACWSPAAVARFRRWAAADAGAAVPLPSPVLHAPAAGEPDADDSPGWLFPLRRKHSFALQGEARWLHADTRSIALGDVVPDAKGEVVLSVHHQAGLRAFPSRVRIEECKDGRDPVSLVRLRVAGPVARVTLTWDPR